MENNNLPEKSEFHYQVVTPRGNPNSIRSLLSILFRQKFYICSFFLLTVISVGLFTILLAETYQSDAKLFIKLGRENIALDPTVIGPTAQVWSDRENELNSEVSVLKGRILAEQVVEQLGANKVLNKEEVSSKGSDNQLVLFIKRILSPLRGKAAVPVDEIAANVLMENLTVAAEKQSHTILLSYQAQSPKLASDVLSTLIDKYRDQHIEMHQAQAPLQFIETKAETLKMALQEKEQQLLNFQEKHSIASLDEQKREGLDQMSLLQKEADQVVSLIGASEAKIRSITSSLQGLSPTTEINRVVGRPNRTVELIKEQLFTLRAREADLAANYPDSDRGLMDLREKIRLAEKQLGQESATITEITQGVDTNYQSLKLSLANEQAQLQALKVRKVILERQIEERNTVLLALSSHETNLGNLKREVDIANNEYQRYRENLQRAQLSADLDSGKYSNVRVIQPPSYASVPVKPRKTLNLLLGILLGATGGLGLAFLREYFDDSIKGTEEAEEKLGLPVLASISRREFESCI